MWCTICQTRKHNANKFCKKNTTEKPKDASSTPPSSLGGREGGKEVEENVAIFNVTDFKFQILSQSL